MVRAFAFEFDVAVFTLYRYWLSQLLRRPNGDEEKGDVSNIAEPCSSNGVRNRFSEA